MFPVWAFNSHVHQDFTLKGLHGSSIINSSYADVQSENKTLADIIKLSMTQRLVLFCWTTADFLLWLAAATIHFGQECVILQHTKADLSSLMVCLLCVSRHNLMGMTTGCVSVCVTTGWIENAYI